MMRSTLVILLCAIIFAPSESQAQLIKGFGLKAGVVSATQTWSYWTNSELPTDAHWGFDSGLFVEALDLPLFSLVVELHYVQKGFSTTFTVTTPAYPEGTGKEMTLQPRVDYLSLPVLAKFCFDAGAFTPYIFGGPRLDILITHTDDGFALVFDKFKKVDAGFSLGAGAEVPIAFGANLLTEFRYSPTVTEAFSNGSLKVKNHSIELLVGVKL
jgi:hypothetical protein